MTTINANNPKRVASYGSWKSPITSEFAAAGTTYPFEVMIHKRDIYWLELRTKESGRYVIMHLTPEGDVEDVTQPPFSARTLVHEYGGGSYAVGEGGVYFSNYPDQHLYVKKDAREPICIASYEKIRYADLVVDEKHRSLVCVQEDHSQTDGEPSNSIVKIDIDRGKNNSKILVEGDDFYSSPRFNPDYSELAWLSWNHPSMPFYGTDLWVGKADSDGSIKLKEKIAGGPEESVCQPKWSPEGVLYFISDRTGWWNIYRYLEGEIETVCGMEAEFCAPQWNFGTSSYAFESEDRIICTYVRDGTWHLAILDTERRKLETVDSVYTEFGYINSSPKFAVLVASSPIEPISVVKFNIETRTFDLLYRPRNTTGFDANHVSIPNHTEFPTSNGLTAYGMFYPPKNVDFEGPPGERAPLIVFSHGGPTNAASTSFQPRIQFWTSRGFAVLDVNYGGSTGYGRTYRLRLDGKWGIVDVDDCVNGALYLAKQGKVDLNKLIIRGGSAGGYTTLCSLTFRNAFKAGASYFGVSDLESLRKETHKFESRYLDRLVGPYPKQKEVYRERSPINYLDNISAAVIFFQGLEDKVVPPNQAERMVEALRKKRIPVAYVSFEGEQHGFRKAENIKRSLDSELYFYSKVFGFSLPEQIEEVKIENI